MTRSGTSRSQRRRRRLLPPWLRHFGYLAVVLAGTGLPAITGVQALIGPIDFRLSLIIGWLLRTHPEAVPVLPDRTVLATAGGALLGLFLVVRTGAAGRLRRLLRPAPATRTPHGGPHDSGPHSSGPHGSGPHGGEPHGGEPHSDGLDRSGLDRGTAAWAGTPTAPPRPAGSGARTGPDHTAAGRTASRAGSGRGPDPGGAARSGAASTACWDASQPALAGRALADPTGAIVTVTTITGSVGRASLAGYPYTVCSVGPRLQPGVPYVVLGRDGDVLIVATTAAAAGG